jgi:hypothetical protein
MIIMGKKKDGSALSMIMKKIGSSSKEHEDLKEENAKNVEEVMKDPAESDYSEGLEAAAKKMMDAFHSKNVSELKDALKSFIEMAMHE